MERYDFVVSGQVFSIAKDAMLRDPPSKLSELCRKHKDEDGPIAIDRPPELFSAILALYQTGTVHMPMSACPGAFLEEMEFWDIKPEVLSTCCFYRLQCFLNEQENLVNFRKKVFDDVDDDVSTLSMALCSKVEQVRRKVWAVVDYKERTVLSRAYFMIALIMVLISIFTIACSTEPMFKRAMTNCERLEYMQSANMDHLDIVAGLLGRHCNSEELPFKQAKPPPKIQGRNKITTYRKDTKVDVEIEENEDSDDFIYVKIEETQDKVAKTQASPKPMNTFADLQFAPNKPKTKVKIPNMRVPIYTLVILDIISLAFFTIEFIIRLLSCPSIPYYFFSVINATDAAALIGTYLHMLLMHLYKHEKYRDDWMDILGYMQILRSLRLFRIVHNVRASRVLAFSIGKNIKDFSVLILFLVVGMCTFASIVYIPENKEMIKSIPTGWYWAIVTMTTVGYGDVTPNTAVGKVIGCLCGVAGVLLFALTVPIFANSFAMFYQYAGLEAAMAKRKQKRKKSSVDIKVYDFCDDFPLADATSSPELQHFAKSASE